MKLSSRKQLLKEADEELETIKETPRLNESETNFLIDRLKKDAGNYKRFQKKYFDILNTEGNRVSVAISTKVPVTMYYDVEHEEVRYDISEDTGTNFPLLEKEVRKSPQFKAEFKKHSDMAKQFIKDCQAWIRETAKKSTITVDRKSVEEIMWNMF